MVRRVATIALLTEDLNANYAAARHNAFVWSQADC
jgi:hypothetical protein